MRGSLQLLVMGLLLGLALSPAHADQEYRDDATGVTLVVPDGWDRKTPPAGARLSVAHCDKDNSLSFKRVSLHQGGDYASIQAFRKSVVSNLPSGWKRVGEGSGRVGPAQSLTSRFEFSRRGLDWEVEIHFFQHKNQYLYLQLTNIQADGSNARQAFGNILSKVRLN